MHRWTHFATALLTFCLVDTSIAEVPILSNWQVVRDIVTKRTVADQVDLTRHSAVN